MKIVSKGCCNWYRPWKSVRIGQLGRKANGSTFNDWIGRKKIRRYRYRNSQTADEGEGECGCYLHWHLDVEQFLMARVWANDPYSKRTVARKLSSNQPNDGKLHWEVVTWFACGQTDMAALLGALWCGCTSTKSSSSVADVWRIVWREADRWRWQLQSRSLLRHYRLQSSCAVQNKGELRPTGQVLL